MLIRVCLVCCSNVPNVAVCGHVCVEVGGVAEGFVTDGALVGRG